MPASTKFDLFPLNNWHRSRNGMQIEWHNFESKILLPYGIGGSPGSTTSPCIAILYFVYNHCSGCSPVHVYLRMYVRYYYSMETQLLIHSCKTKVNIKTTTTTTLLTSKNECGALWWYWSHSGQVLVEQELMVLIHCLEKENEKNTIGKLNPL